MILDSFKLDGKVAIVTGASQGIGQGIAVALAEAGADIVSFSRGDHTETEKLITDRNRKFMAYDIDLTDISTFDKLVKEVIAKFGKIDILVNNAGTIKREDAINFSENDWDLVMNINIKTVFFLSQRVGKEFFKQGSGKIINIASMLSFQGGIRVPSYTASKSAVKGVTMALANEWANKGINVNAIAPGYIETENTAPIRADQNRTDSITARIPAGRWGKPSDLMGTVVFLASSASDYIHGYTIAVDGGWLAR